MNTGFKYFFKILCLLLYSSLVSCTHDVREPYSHCNSCTLISKVKSNEAVFVGHVVRIVGVYETDNMHFTYIKSIHSSNPRDEYLNLIRVGPGNDMGNESVSKFFSMGKDMCEKKMKTSHPMCIQAAYIDAYVHIIRNEYGLSANIKKLYLLSTWINTRNKKPPAPKLTVRTGRWPRVNK